MATENKMGVMPLNRLLISMSVPMMISMLVQALYNIVDSMFVAQLSENALTAVSLAFPAQNLMIAVATGTGVGVNAALSRNLGEKNFDRANRIADHALFLAAMSYIVFALFGLFFARQFFRLQTDIEEIVDLGTTYLRVCTIASFGLFMEIACERLLQSTGKTIYSMYTQGLGAIINIVLDPILIFGYFGAPALGIAGAAGATVFGQIIAYNYGAGKPDRIMGTIKLAAVYATTIMLCGFAVFQLMPDKLLMIFSASDTMLSIGIPALRIISISFLFAGCSIVCTSLFQALGHGMLSLWISVFRQLVVLLPVAFIFARIGGLHTVWFAFPIAEAFAIIFSGVCLVHVYRKEIIPLKAQQGK